jgi:hypothetical protein
VGSGAGGRRVNPIFWLLLRAESTNGNMQLALLKDFSNRRFLFSRSEHGTETGEEFF